MLEEMIADPAMLTRLGEATEPVRFCDPEGRTIGYFLSGGEYPRPYPQWLHDEADAMHSEEELDRRSAEPGGRTLAEFWASINRS